MRINAVFLLKELIQRADAQVITEATIQHHVISEVEAHVKLGLARAETYFETQWGQEILEKVNELVQSGQGHLVVIQGLPGSGKTSLMAKLMVEVSQRFGSCSPGYIVISRFLGNTNSSSSARELMCSIMEQIDLIDFLIDLESRSAGPAELESITRSIATKPALDLSSDFSQLAKAFSDGLRHICAKEPLILLLDGLDKVYDDEEGGVLSWLPTTLPPGLMVVTTALESQGSFDTVIQGLQEKSGEGSMSVFHISETSRDDGNKMLDCYLERHGRRLSDVQKNVLMETFR